MGQAYITRRSIRGGYVMITVTGSNHSGITVTMTKDGVSRSCATDSAGVAKIYFNDAGVYTLTSACYGLPETIDCVKGGIYALTAYSSANDRQAWLEIGGLDPDDYETLAAVVNSASAMETLANNARAVCYMVSSTGAIMSAVVESVTAMTQIGLSSMALDACFTSGAWAQAILESENAIAGLDAAEPVTVPVMTSAAATGGGAVIASVCNASYPAWRVFRALQTDTSNAGVTVFNTMPCWCGFTWENNPALWCYRFAINTTQAYSQPTAFELQGSNDAEEWATLGSYTMDGWTVKTWTKFNVQTPGKYRYLRIYCTAARNIPAQNVGMRISNLQFYCK